MTILITGARRGIGKAIADLFSSNNESVITHSRADGDLSISQVAKNLLEKTSPETLICCTGGTKGNDWENVFKDNLYSVTTICNLASETMKPGGKIITIGSYAACFGSPNHIPYCVAKAALHEYSRCLASKLRDKNISVNCIAPGNVATERFLEEGNSGANLQAEDIAEAVMFLYKTNAISGQIIRIDKGKHSFPC